MKWQRRIWVVLLNSAVFWIVMLLGRMYLTAEPKEYRVVYIPKVLDEESDFWVQMREGIEMAASEGNAQVSVAGAAVESDYETQNRLLEQAVAEMPDAVILCPSGYQETAEMAKKVTEAGIVLVVVDSELEGNPGGCLVATDNIEAGRKQGEWLKSYLTDTDQIAVIAHERNASTAVDRLEGLKVGLGERSSQIATVCYSGSSYENAEAVTEQLLRDQPEITVIVGLNEYTTVGAAAAVKKLGVQDQVSMVGFDSSIAEIKLLEEGLLTATVIQKPFVMGYSAMEEAFLMIQGKAPDAPFIDSGSVLITADTLYQTENQKLLFPFQQN